jgi:hypothetical protein
MRTAGRQGWAWAPRLQRRLYGSLRAWLPVFA